jgi:ring-1,2-phenylacetyl-CoA epoxidase subunit PaaD
MLRIESDIRDALLANGFTDIKINTALSPAWTTDWMTEGGKKKLKEYGIAPPTSTHSVCHIELFQQDEAIACPRCASYNTALISRFGSTPCKAVYRCNDCLEPFDYFKCH